MIRTAAPHLLTSCWSRLQVDGRFIMRPLRSTGRSLAILGISSVMLPIYLALRAARQSPEARLRLAARWTERWARSMAAVCGVRVESAGPLPPPGALLTPNHTGYIDVLAIGTLLRCFFAPKSEAAGWPLIGPLIRASEQVLIVRKRGRSILASTEAIAQRLDAGERVCLFLEGTSSGGGVLPFKSPLLEPAMQRNTPIVPLALHYRSTERDVSIEEHVAYWKARHMLAPHLWRLLGLRGVRVRVIFGEPIWAEAGEGRSELALRLEKRVCALYAQAAGGE